MRVAQVADDGFVAVGAGSRAGVVDFNGAVADVFEPGAVLVIIGGVDDDRNFSAPRR